MLGCAVLYSLTAGGGKKLTWQKLSLRKKKKKKKGGKKAVNNRNSIKLPWFPVSYALWTAWSDRGWLAERLVGYRLGPHRSTESSQLALR